MNVFFQQYGKTWQLELLKVWLHGESEILNCYIKTCWLVSHFGGIVPHTWFCSIMHWSFGKQWLHESCGFPKYWHISLQLQKKKKSHLVITNLTSKIFKCWYTIKLTVKDTSFPKFQFSLESLNSVMDNKHCQSLFTKWRAHSIPLCEHVCQLQGLKKCSSCITGSLKLKWCFMGGKG